HESPDTLFPGTGRPAHTGGPGAQGAAVNVALPAGTRDAGWLRAFHAAVPPPPTPPPRRAGGSSPAAAATSPSRSSPAPGPACSPKPPMSPSPPRPLPRRHGGPTPSDAPASGPPTP